jgi:ribonuclease P protein component
VLVVKPAKPGQGPKPRIIISNKVAKLAVQRNRIRRLIREAVRPRQNLVIIAQKSIVNKNFHEIKAELNRLLPV